MVSTILSILGVIGIFALALIGVLIGALIVVAFTFDDVFDDINIDNETPSSNDKITKK